MPELPTQPGTEISETPEMLAPIMPKATMPHGELRWPRKKLSLSSDCRRPRESHSRATK